MSRPQINKILFIFVWLCYLKFCVIFLSLKEKTSSQLTPYHFASIQLLEISISVKSYIVGLAERKNAKL